MGIIVHNFPISRPYPWAFCLKKKVPFVHRAMPCWAQVAGFPESVRLPKTGKVLQVDFEK